MTDTDNKILQEALNAFRDPWSTTASRDNAAQRVFQLLQDRDHDDDVAECQNAVGRSGCLEELFELYKQRSSSEYVTLCLTWALFRNPFNSDILGRRPDFGPTIKSVIEDPELSSARKSHAMDLWDNVVNNLSKFEPHILEIIPAFVKLLETSKFDQIKGRCVNSARISSYREVTRERLRKTRIVELLLEIIGSSNEALAPHAACQAVANLVGHIPNHPALASAAVCVENLVQCFGRALDDKDYPEGTNTYPNDYFVCMGLANMANHDSMKRVLVGHGILELLEKALFKLEKQDKRLQQEAYRCLARITTLPDLARQAAGFPKIMQRIEFMSKLAAEKSTQRLAKEVKRNIIESQYGPAAPTAPNSPFGVGEVVTSKGPGIVEVKVTHEGIRALRKELKLSGFSLLEHPRLASQLAAFESRNRRRSSSLLSSAFSFISSPIASIAPGGGFAGSYGGSPRSAGASYSPRSWARLRGSSATSASSPRSGSGSQTTDAPTRPRQAADDIAIFAVKQKSGASPRPSAVEKAIWKLLDETDLEERSRGYSDLCDVATSQLRDRVELSAAVLRTNALPVVRDELLDSAVDKSQPGTALFGGFGGGSVMSPLSLGGGSLDEGEDDDEKEGVESMELDDGCAAGGMVHGDLTEVPTLTSPEHASKTANIRKRSGSNGSSCSAGSNSPGGSSSPSYSGKKRKAREPASPSSASASLGGMPVAESASSDLKAEAGPRTPTAPRVVRGLDESASDCAGSSGGLTSSGRPAGSRRSDYAISPLMLTRSVEGGIVGAAEVRSMLGRISSQLMSPSFAPSPRPDSPIPEAARQNVMSSPRKKRARLYAQLSAGHITPSSLIGPMTIAGVAQPRVRSTEPVPKSRLGALRPRIAALLNAIREARSSKKTS